MKRFGSQYGRHHQIHSLETLPYPPIILLNDVLSCLPQDVVRLSSSGVSPSLMSLYSSQQEYSFSDPKLLPRLSYIYPPFFHSSCKWSFQPAIAESSLEGFSDIAPLVRQLRHSHPVVLCFSFHADVHYDTSPVGVAVFAPLRQARRRPRIRPGGR